jgi:hypothetical protein
MNANYAAMNAIALKYPKFMEWGTEFRNVNAEWLSSRAAAPY